VRPFCFVVSFTHPHDPYTIPQQWWDLYADEDIPMPTFGYDESTATPHERRLRHVCAMDDAEITPEQTRSALRAYRGAISYVDHHIARLIDVLRVTGRLDNTVVILTSDHGDMLGERGLWYKMSFFDGAARVPLIVSAPSRFEPGRVSAPVSTMDLLPTLVGLANGGDLSGIVGDIDGQSLLPLLSGEPDERATVVAEYLAEGAVAPIVMVRRHNVKLAVAEEEWRGYVRSVLEALNAHAQACFVHHHEHRVEPAIFFTEEPACGAAIVHHAGGVTVDAHLLFNRAAADGIACAQRTVVLHQELRNQEQRDPFGSRRRAFDASKHEVNNIFRQIVFAGRDENFGAAYLVAAIRLFGCLRSQ
jgi:hypothetical protein